MQSNLRVFLSSKTTQSAGRLHMATVSGRNSKGELRAIETGNYAEPELAKAEAEQIIKQWKWRA